MVAQEEATRTDFSELYDCFFMHSEKLASDPLKKEFSSKDVVISKEELKLILKEYNYFKPQ